MPDAEARLGAYPHQYSGGMRQRVMIAMALACHPKLLIADEPTTALDVTIQAQVLELMKRIRAQTGTAILLISHDLGVIAEMCERVVVLYAGRVVEDGAVRAIFSNATHPYTRGLLQSIPRLNDECHRLSQIPGSVPLPGQVKAGCPFHARCALRIARCAAEMPPLTPLGGGHRAACWVTAA
jgi:peptide/nickel transport system ATP-binding protein